MGDWSAVPVDILAEILLKLDSADELVYFSVVCQSWHSAYSMAKKKWTAKTPWLMLPENTTQENKPNNYLRKLYCLNRQRCYQLKLPETYGAKCWGSTCGWIVTLDLDLEVHIFNPLTTARIRLPPYPGPKLIPANFGFGSDGIRRFFTDKAIVFEDEGRDDYIVMITPGNKFGALLYARPGDQAWTIIRTKLELRIKYGKVKEVLRWGTKMLFLFRLGGVGYCDMNAILNSEPVTLQESLPSPISPVVLSNHKIQHRVCLLESCGDLLMVIRYLNDLRDENVLDRDFPMVHFKVYKFKFETSNWVEVNDIGDVALFVGNNTSMSIHASHSNNCKRNCIYFTDNHRKYWNWKPLFGGEDDIGLFNLTHQEFEIVCRGDDVQSNSSNPLWFMPKF